MTEYTHHSTVFAGKAWHINYSGVQRQARTHIPRRPQAQPGDIQNPRRDGHDANQPHVVWHPTRAKLATRLRLLEVESRQDAGIGQSERLRLVAGASDACDVARGVGSGDGRAGCLLEDPLDLGDAVATLGDVVRGADGVAHEDRVQLERLHNQQLISGVRGGTLGRRRSRAAPAPQAKPSQAKPHMWQSQQGAHGHIWHAGGLERAVLACHEPAEGRVLCAPIPRAHGVLLAVKYLAEKVEARQQQRRKRRRRLPAAGGRQRIRVVRDDQRRPAPLPSARPG